MKIEYKNNVFGVKIESPENEMFFNTDNIPKVKELFIDRLTSLFDDAFNDQQKTAKKVIITPYFYGHYYNCPFCNKELGTNFDDLRDVNFCSKCGQLLDWTNLRD